jgi:LPXTG-motif cell wall-anchored protein
MRHTSAGANGGGQLAATGVDGGTVVAGGAGLIAVGMLALGMTRRRRDSLG